MSRKDIMIGTTSMGDVVMTINALDKSVILTRDCAIDLIRCLDVAIKIVTAPPKDGRVH